MKKQATIKELAHDYFKRGQLGLVSPDSESAYTEAMKFSQEFVRFQTELPEIKEKPSSYTEPQTKLYGCKLV